MLDTILEKIEGNAGSDMAVVMAGYQPQMEELFRNCKASSFAHQFLSEMLSCLLAPISIRLYRCQLCLPHSNPHTLLV